MVYCTSVFNNGRRTKQFILDISAQGVYESVKHRISNALKTFVTTTERFNISLQFGVSVHRIKHMSLTDIVYELSTHDHI